MPLIPAQDVRDFLPTLQLTDKRLAAIDLLVAGWLRQATGQPLPVELSEGHPLYGPAFELTVLTAVNPEGLASITNGPTTRSFTGDMARRAAILATVTAAPSSGRPAGQPLGSFPPPDGWPDPAERPHRAGW